MLWITGLVAATLAGAEGPKRPDSPMITYQLRHLEMNGVGWRSSLHPKLVPVARQGSATVWTAPRDAATELSEKAARVLQAPRVSSNPQAPVTFFQNSARPLVTGLTRQADGPVNHATRVGFTPTIETATEGWKATIDGRKLDQGVLTHVTMEETQILAVYAVSLSETTETKGTGDGQVLKATMQVPEVARAGVSGEWLIPTDGVLVVSFGPRTSADADGKAVVRERLAVIEATETPGMRAGFLAGPLRVALPEFRNVAVARAAEAAVPLPVPVPVPLPAPAVPKRSLPQGRNSEGHAVPLPPLPADATPPTALPESSEPCATPQTRGGPVGDPIPPPRDAASKRAGHPADAAAVDRSVTRSNWAPAPTPTRPFTFRVPVNSALLKGELCIEIDARYTPGPSAAVPAPPVVAPSHP